MPNLTSGDHHSVKHLSWWMRWHLRRAINIVKQGGLIAYPTEAVFGLGCDPFNEAAVTRLLALKKRSPEKGLILIASHWEQITPLIETLTPEQLSSVQASWPGAVTWLLPASALVPAWIRGSHSSIAIRMSAHPIAHYLCHYFSKPLVSTSANFSDELPAKTASEVRQQFGDQIDYIVPGAVGDLAKPTPIYDVVTKKMIREG